MKKSITTVLKSFLLVTIGLWSISTHAAIHYVAPSGSSAWSGQTVYNDVASAITAASTGDEIWIAGGEYSVGASITMKSIKIYGGFAGTETAVDQRPKAANSKAWEFENLSVLKLTAGVNMFNATSAVSFTLNGVVLDGDLLTGGRAVQITFNATNYNVNLTNSIFRNFKSGGDGGAFNIRYSNVVISHSLITGNNGNKGGAGYFDNGVVIHDCEITNNSVTTGQTSYQGSTAGGGGGLFLANAGTGVKVYNCYIANNTASFGGGVFVRTNSSVYNSIILNNTSSASGSGVCFDGRDNSASVYNCIVANNNSTMTNGAGLVFTSTSTGNKVTKLFNTVLYNNTDVNETVLNIGSVVTAGAVIPAVNNNILDKNYDGLTATATVIETDATNLFSDILTNNFTPPANFVGVDMGDATGLSFLSALDYAGANRFQGSSIDIGPYEFTTPTQLVNFAASNVLVTPESVSSVVTGGSLSFEFTPDAGYHSPYVAVNNKRVEPIKNGDVYTFEIQNITSTQTIQIAAFEANVLPVSEDTYQRRNGEISGYYKDMTTFESRGETAGYAAIPLLKFVPTDAMKTAGYNKVSLRFVPVTTVANLSYTVRQFPTEFESIYVVGANDYTKLMEAPAVGTADQQVAFTANQPVELNVTDSYVLNFPEEITISLVKGSNSTVHYLHSLENGNTDYVPALVFSTDISTGNYSLENKVNVYYQNAKLQINNLKQSERLQITDMFGRKVYEEILNDESNTVNCTLAKGIYFVKVGTKTVKLLVNN